LVEGPLEGRRARGLESAFLPRGDEAQEGREKRGREKARHTTFIPGLRFIGQRMRHIARWRCSPARI
jgi:hypothetical protein